jgi:hypothetical protein
VAATQYLEQIRIVATDCVVEQGARPARGCHARGPSARSPAGPFGCSPRPGAIENVAMGAVSDGPGHTGARGRAGRATGRGRR